jgi:hypothetical protein
MGVENADAIVKNFMDDGTVLVSDTSLNGKGSPNYIDTARLLSPDHLKCIDKFIDETHADGGSVSVPVVADELLKTFPDLFVSDGCVRYAMKNFCNDGLGHQWGDIKARKCDSDPERIDVKRTYLRDYAKALKKEELGTHIIVYFGVSLMQSLYAMLSPHFSMPWCCQMRVTYTKITRQRSRG